MVQWLQQRTHDQRMVGSSPGMAMVWCQRRHHGPMVRAVDSRSEVGGFEPWHGCGVVSLSKALYFSLLLPTQE